MSGDQLHASGLIDDVFAARLDQLLALHDRIAIAVSGGSDSIALMHLVAARVRWAPQRFATTTILTVDHRMRRESTAEANRVGEMARAAGFSQHAILTWTGPHPSTGVQAAARAARYRLIGDYCRDHDIAGFATAHTRDDQAETVLMRLARGSGIDGLAGMAPVRWLHDGVWHYRPLLDVSRADLRGYLAAIAATWIEDPSNENPAFERVRWRQTRRDLDALGLTDAAVTRSAARAARASQALAWATDRAVEAAGAAFSLSPLGFAVMSKRWLNTLPLDIRVRVFGRLIEAFGGHGSAPSLSALEDACDGLCNASSPVRRGFTLHGAMVRAAGDRVTVLREAIGARRGNQVDVHIDALPLAVDDAVTWDCRFAMHLGPGAPEPATVGPLGAVGLSKVRQEGHSLPDSVPSRVLWALPALTFPTCGVAVPHLAVWPSGLTPDMVHFGPIHVPFEGAAKVEGAKPK